MSAPGDGGVDGPALFQRFPALRGAIPHLPLGRFPTRVHRLDGVVPAAVELWIKRDDESGAIYGGNKVRKLEFILAEARARGAERLVTLGAFGSHHVLATGIYGAQAGFGVDAVVFPQPITAHVKEDVLAGAAAGITFHPVGSYLGVPAKVARLRARKKSCWVAAGGSSAVGTLGYVSAALELGDQIARGECPEFDAIYVALGSCGTVAGLWYGLWLDGRRAELRAVRVVDRVVTNRGSVERLMHQTMRLVEPRIRDSGARRNLAPMPPLVVEHGHFGGGYGVTTAAADEAVRAAGAAHLSLETTYTGKAFAALMADARAGRLDGKRVLFWDTFSSVDLAPLVARAPSPSSLPRRLAALFADRDG